MPREPHICGPKGSRDNADEKRYIKSAKDSEILCTNKLNQGELFDFP